MRIEIRRTSQAVEDHQACERPAASEEEVLKFKKRMLEWPSPVEYVNNMYGCHPNDDGNEYFKVVFAK
ncbi:MAG: hypothetical protein AB1714_00705 [Acidobacteriota bacterium]